MHTPQKATAALALLAVGWIGAAATPAFADQHGVADKAAAYQAEGLGTTTDEFGPSTDLVPTVSTDAHLGGTGLVTQTDAGLASLTGLDGGQGAAAAETPAAAAAPAGLGDTAGRSDGPGATRLPAAARRRGRAARESVRGRGAPPRARRDGCPERAA
jgi:hypothetical protein